MVILKLHNNYNMDIPTATSSQIDLNTGIIINDNFSNLTFTEDEPKQLSNQIAVQDNCIISISPSTTNSFFFITMPYSSANEMNDSSLITNQYTRKLKIMCLLIFFTYTIIICFTITFLYYQNYM